MASTTFFVVLCSLCVTILGQLRDGGSCEQTGHLDFRSDPGNCQVFFRCDRNRLFRFDCGPGTVYNKVEKTCVALNGPNDICSTQKPVSDRGAVCSNVYGENLIAHNVSCSLYYDCNAPSQWRWEMNLQECMYPEVFNSKKRKCEHYSAVNCGDRKLPLGRCEYHRSICRSSHCQPCLRMFPSCRGMSDGLHPFPGWEQSPRFIVCVAERLVYKGNCFQERGLQIFDSDLNSCVVKQS